MTDYNEIRKADPEIFEIMEMEEKRQESFLELIASENIVSKAVMQAAGPVRSRVCKCAAPFRQSG